jgi:peptidyl-prolyl cis-trans isomerase SurA
MKTRFPGVAALASLAVLACVAAPQAQILEQILVKVNGDIITKTDLETRQIAALRQMPNVQNMRPDSDELRQAVAQITPEVIVDAVDELVLVQRGRELGYTLGNDQFASIIENIRKENKLESDEQFQEALRQEGLSMADLRRQLERQMLITRVQQAEVLGRIGVTDEEARTYWAANRASFTTPPQITLREILVTVPTTPQGINVGADDDAKAKAEEARRRAMEGEPFARLAAELSDAPSKANGGLVGPLSRNDLAEPLQRALDGMQPGDVSDVLRIARGYLVLRLETSEGETVKAFEEAKEEISERIFQQKQRAEFGRYLARLRSQAIIEWKNDEIKKAYDLGLEQQARELAGATGR